MAEPKILFIDIETSPNLAHVWGIWDQNVGLSQLLESTEVMCFAAKWAGAKKVSFYSQPKDGKEGMVLAAHRLLDEADVVVHYNGRSFDIPHLNREFLQAKLTPPSPYHQVDLLVAVKKKFRFPSNKLAYVSEAIGLGGKVKHEGHELWVKCLAGNRQAWATMRAYNIQDVELLEDVYEILKPWIPNHPTMTLIDPGSPRCPLCRSEALIKRGYAYTKVSKFVRYQCQDCGKYSRASKRIGAVSVQESN